MMLASHALRLLDLLMKGWLLWLSEVMNPTVMHIFFFSCIDLSSLFMFSSYEEHRAGRSHLVMYCLSWRANEREQWRWLMINALYSFDEVTVGSWGYSSSKALLHVYCILHPQFYDTSCWLHFCFRHVSVSWHFLASTLKKIHSHHWARGKLQK